MNFLIQKNFIFKCHRSKYRMQGREVVQWYEMLFPLKFVEGTWAWGLDLGLHFPSFQL